MAKLTARKAQTALCGKHEDGDGLRLVVSLTGKKRWVLRVTVYGRRREMGLGRYPEVSLAEARTKAAAAQKLAHEGQDPIAARKAHFEPAPNFAACATAYIEAHAPGWASAKHAAQWRATLATYAYRFIGGKPIDRVVTEDVLRILKPIWTTKTETAKRVQGRIENIIGWATAHRYRTGENPAQWRGHLDMLLARPSRVRAVIHHPAMPYDEVPAFMGELAGKPGVSALALRFLILTAARTSEVLGATWAEIDLEAATWTIPATRMKARQLHRVPLSKAALGVLEALPRIEGTPYLFPGVRYGRPISTMALLQLMRGMGYGVGGGRGDYVPHGFRSSFRDWAGEVSSFPRDVCEMALAHVVGNKVEAAYRRGDMFEKRRAMMDAWSMLLLRN
jgi:integrase